MIFDKTETGGTLMLRLAYCGERQVASVQCLLLFYRGKFQIVDSTDATMDGGILLALLSICRSINIGKAVQSQ